MPLIHPVDALSVKSELYKDHFTKVVKLVPPTIRKRLLALAKEETE